MPPSARVLVIDNDPQVREDLLDILTKTGYQAIAPAGAGQTLLTEAVRQAKQFRPHVAVVDLRLSDDDLDRPEGLRLTMQLKPARSIIYSAYLNVPVTMDALQSYGVFTLVNKADDVDKLLEAVDQSARQVCAARRGIHFTRPPACCPAAVHEQLRLGLDGQGGDDLLDDLLAAAFPGQTVLRLDTIEGEGETHQPVQRGRTALLRVWTGDRIVEQLLKIAPAEKILRERESYMEYIQDNLGGRFYAQLNGCQTFYELGAAMYSFLGHNGKPLQTLAEAYPRLTMMQVERLFEHFFVDVWGSLYRDRRPLPPPLYDAYEEPLHLDRRLAEAAGMPETLELPELGFPLPNPFAWLAKNRRALFHQQPTESARTHGDLHTGNLLTDGEHTWTIDFERTGWGPVLRDFVELEVDLATRLVDPANGDPRDALRFAVTLCRRALDPQQTQPVFRMDALREGMGLIASLRGLAQRVVGDYDPREYLFGLLCDAVFVASNAQPGSVPHTRAITLGAAAAASLDPSAEFPPRGWAV